MEAMFTLTNLQIMLIVQFSIPRCVFFFTFMAGFFSVSEHKLCFLALLTSTEMLVTVSSCYNMCDNIMSHGCSTVFKITKIGSNDDMNKRF